MLQTRSYPIGLLVYALELRISPRVLANCRESFLAAHSNKPERLRVARFLVAIFFYDWIDPQDQQTEYIYIYILYTHSFLPHRSRVVRWFFSSLIHDSISSLLRPMFLKYRDSRRWLDLEKKIYHVAITSLVDKGKERSTKVLPSG